MGGGACYISKVVALYLVVCLASSRPSADIHTARTWHMLVADDCQLEAEDPEYRPALVVLFVLCAVCRVSLSWNRSRGL